MKTLGNTLAERKNARWGRRAGLAYAERVSDECSGEVRVREVNHGLHGCGSRTCLRTVRVRLRRMYPPKQSFFGASTLPNISRRQALAQPIRVIRGSNLQRLDRLRVEEERHDADKGYAFLVHPRLFIGVASNDDFAEVVSRVGQGECFLRPLLFIGNRKGGLDVDAFGGLVDDKVDFMTSHFVLPVGKYIVGYLADVNRITATDELVVNRVLHQMRALVLSKSQRGVAQTAVSSIVLERRVKIVVAFDVESLGLCKHEGVDEEVQVFGNGNTVGLDSHDGLDGIRQFRRIRGAADVAHGCCSQRIQKYVVFEPIPFGDVTKVNGFVKIRKVSHLLVRGLAQHTPRKTAEIEVFVKDGVEVAGGFAQGEEFRHGKRRVVVSFYDHGTLAFVCMINIMFCKAVVLYHNFKLRSRNTFNSRADAQKFKAMKWAA